MLQPAKGLGFDIEVAGDIFLRHPLQHMRMGLYILQETFPGILPQLIEKAMVFSDKKVRYDEPAQTLELGVLVIQLFQALIADGKKDGRLDGLHNTGGGCAIKKGQLGANHVSFHGQLNGLFSFLERYILAHQSTCNDIEVTFDLTLFCHLYFFIIFPDLDIGQKVLELQPGNRKVPGKIVV